MGDMFEQAADEIARLRAQVERLTAERDAAVAKAERLTAEEQEHLDLIAKMSESSESREAFIRGLQHEIERRKRLFRLVCKANDALVAQRDALQGNVDRLAKESVANGYELANLREARSEMVAALRSISAEVPGESDPVAMDCALDRIGRLSLGALAKHGGGS